jgi:hypothetical protein
MSDVKTAENQIKASVCLKLTSGNVCSTVSISGLTSDSTVKEQISEHGCRVIKTTNQRATNEIKMLTHLSLWQWQAYKKQSRTQLWVS